jgi:predicted Ser/Thr protein kinase
VAEVERFQHIRRLFQELRDAPPAERRERLLAEPEVADEVQALLDAASEPSALDQALSSLRAEQPAQLGPYRVLRELGRGGMGVVYEAEQQAPARRVALKTLPPGLPAPALRALFRKEAQVMATSVHPGIPHVYEVFDADGEPVVAMEFVDGLTFDHVARGLDLPARAAILEAVADAVGWAHTQGVVHRDLKPTNILVTAGGQAKVIDFGVAQLGDDDGPRGSGTRAYMAPEQRAGERVGPAADVWALGALGRELLEPADPELRAILDRATQDAPATRYADGQALAAELRRWRRGQVPRAARRTPAALLRALRRRAPWAPAALAATTALAALSVAAAFGSRDALERGRAQAADQAAAQVELELAAVEAFGLDPAHAGTPAVSALWARYAAQTHGAARRRALTSALVTATEDASRLELLETLGVELAAELRWPAVGAVLSALPADRARALRAREALARWSLAEALPLLDEDGQAMLRPLLTASDVGPVRRGALLPDGGALALTEEGLVRRGPDGAVRHRWPELREVSGLHVSGDRAWAVVGDPYGPLVELRPDGALATTLPGPMFPETLSALDADRDGAPELYLTLPHPARDLWVSSPLGAPPRALHPPTTALRAELTAAPWDLDGDGQQELLVLGTPSDRGDLRVLTGLPDQVRVRERVRVSGRSVVAGRAPDGGTFVAVGAELVGDGAVQLLRWDGRLTPQAAIALPHSGRHLAAVDVDDDGLGDLVVTGFTPTSGQLATSWVRQRPDGSWGRPVTLPNVTHVADLPGSPRLWLRAGLTTWITDGRGNGFAPREISAEPPVSVGVAEEDPRLAGVRHLASLGLRREVAEALLAVSPTRYADRALARARALELLGGDDEALAHARAWLAGPLGAERDAIAATLTDRGDLEGLLRLAAAGGPVNEVVPALQAATLDERFDRPLAPAWDVHHPAGLRRLPLDGQLQLGWTDEIGAIASLPLDWSGGPLLIEVELTVEELDWAAAFALTLEQPGWSLRASLWRRDGERPGETRELLRCRPDVAPALPPGDLTGPRTIRLVWWGGRVGCALGEDHTRLVAHAAPPGGPTRLLLGGHDEGDGPWSGGRVRVRSLRVWGASLGAARGDDLRRGVAEGSAAAVQAGLSSPDPEVVASASARLGRPTLPDALPAGAMRLLLRVDPVTWAPAALTRPWGAARLLEVWGGPLTYGDPWASPLLTLDALRALDLSTSEGRRLGLARARALVEAGSLIEAEDVLRQLREAPDGAEAWRLTARVRVTTGDHAGAAEAIRRWIERSPAPELALDRLQQEPALLQAAPELRGLLRWPP